MQLHEKYRPRRFADVIGQPKVVSRLDLLEQKTGFGGHAFWISGKSGQGKTTLANIIAASVADRWHTTETIGRLLTTNQIKDHARNWGYSPMSGNGYALVVNESHGLAKPVIECFLDLLEHIPDYVVVIFTTTKAGQDLFEEHIDGCPFLSRCITLRLTDQGLCQAFAVRAKEIAEIEGLDGQPVEAYQRLVKRNGNNMRAVLTEIESGVMLYEVNP